MSRTIKFPDSQTKIYEKIGRYRPFGMFEHQDHNSERPYKKALNRRARRREKVRLSVQREDYDGPTFEPFSHKRDNYLWEVY